MLLSRGSSEQGQAARAETGPGVQVTHPAREAEQIKESPAEGVYIHGLYLDGCAWSGRENKLVDAEPKRLFNPLPVLYVTGVLVSGLSGHGAWHVLLIDAHVHDAAVAPWSICQCCQVSDLAHHHKRLEAIRAQL